MITDKTMIVKLYNANVSLIILKYANAMKYKSSLSSKRSEESVFSLILDT